MKYPRRAITGISFSDAVRGISLIEALAAMVILSLGFTIVFTWLISSTDRAARLRQEESSLIHRLETIDFMRGINPFKQPNGQVQLGDRKISWSSQLIGQSVRGVDTGGGGGAYELALFDVQVKTSASDPLAIPIELSFRIQLAGYQLVQNPQSGLRGFLGLAR